MGNRALLGILTLVGFFLVLSVCISANHQAFTTAVTVPSPKNLKLSKPIKSWSNYHGVNHDYDLNYVSKRKVPNGPDPIHNRLAGKYRRQPGRD